MIFSYVAGDWKPQRTSRVLKHERGVKELPACSPKRANRYALKEKKSFRYGLKNKRQK